MSNLGNVYEFPQGASATPAAATPPAPQVEVRPVGWSAANVAALNAIARHDEVWPHISNDNSVARDVFDLDLVVRNGDNHVVGAYVEGRMVGFWLMLARTLDVYECHTHLLPEARGAVATAALPHAIFHMMTRTPAMVLMGEVPAINPAARKLATWAGFKSMDVRPTGWMKDGEDKGVEVMYLHILDWLRGRGGDMRRRASSLISMTAINGMHAKSAALYHVLTAILGPLGGV